MTQAQPNTDSSTNACAFFLGGVRSGTTVFRKMLASHPGLRDRGEIFNSGNPAGYFKFFAQRVVADADAAFPERSAQLFKAYLGHTAAKGGALALLDVKYEHLSLLPEPWQLPFTQPALLRHIKRSGCKAIHLRRQHFYSVVSNLVAVQTGRYHDRVEGGEALPQKKQVRIERDTLLAQMRRRKRVCDVVDTALDEQQRLSLDYESVFDEDGQFNAQMCERVAAFLGLEPRFDRQPGLRKVISEPLSDVIENYDEIKDLERADI